MGTAQQGVEPTSALAEASAKYDAFLSYSHAADGRLAPAVQAGLQHLTRPWYRLRALHVFRDKTSLAATPALWPTIVAALRQSRYFLLMASPAAAESKWVQEECEWWLQHRPADRLLIVLTEGTLAWDAASGDFDWQHTTALPKALAGRFSSEPLFVDVRWARNADHLSVRHLQFREAILDLAAPIHGRDKDLLDGEDVRRFRFARRLAMIGVAALVALTVVAVVFWRQAVVQRDQALVRQLAAQALVELKQNPQRALVLAAQAATIARGAPRAMPAAEAALRAALANAGGRPLGNRLSPVQAIAISPDGRWLAAAGGSDLPAGDPTAMGRTVTTWDLRDLGQPPRLLSGHQGAVTTISFSPDSRRLASGSFDGTIRVWTLATPGATPLILSGHQGWVVALAFSPDSRRLASGSGAHYYVLGADGVSDFTVRLWNLGSASPADGIVLGEHLDTVTAVAFSPDGSVLASASRDGTARVWNLGANGQPRAPTVLGKADRVFVTALAFSEDGRSLATAHDSTVLLWRIRGGSVSPEPSEVGYVGGTVSALAFQPLHRALAAVSSTNDVVLWDLATGKPGGQPLVLKGHENRVGALAFSASGELLVTGGFDRTARVWSLGESAREPVVLRGHEGEVTAVAFSPDGRLVVTGSRDGSVRVWHHDTNATAEPTIIRGAADRYLHHALSHDGSTLATSVGSDVALWDLSQPDVELRRGFGLTNRRALLAIGLDSAGKRLAVLSGISDGALAIVDVLDPLEAVWEVAADSSPAARLVFGPDDRRLLLVPALGKPVRCWDTTDAGAPPRTLSVQRNVLAMSRDRSGLIAAGGENTAVVWDLRASDPAATEASLSGHESLVLAVAWSPDGRLAATGSRDRTARVWDLEERRWIVSLPEQPSPVTAVAFSDDGSLLATGGGSLDRRVRVWAVHDPSVPRHDFVKHEEGITHLAFTAGSTRLASASGDGAVFLWDLEADSPAAEPAVLSEGNSTASGFNAKTDLAIGGNGRWLMSADVSHGTVRLWRLRRDDLVEAACRTAGRTFTQQEWERLFGTQEYPRACATYGAEN